MTTIYFVRHAKPNSFDHSEDRVLDVQGLKDRVLVNNFLEDIEIDVFFSSPYQRAIQTILEVATVKDKKIQLIDEFRERKITNGWIENFETYSKNQWLDFNYKFSDGESLKEVQDRNIRALNDILSNHENQTICIGTHGTSLSTIINYYHQSFGYDDFLEIKSLMPWIVKCEFNQLKIRSIKSYHLFLNEEKEILKI